MKEMLPLWTFLLGFGIAKVGWILDRRALQHDLYRCMDRELALLNPTQSDGDSEHG